MIKSKNNLFLFDEKKLSGCKYLIGTDEAGRGPGAGPVFAAAVCFSDTNKELKKALKSLNDSKQLTEKVREELYDIIKENSIWSIKASSVEQIEKINILQASLSAMREAVEEVQGKLEADDFTLIIDGNKLIPKCSFRQEFVIKGDSKSAAIAAASILAKVERDRYMKELAKEHPEYEWHKNKGYLTKEHLDAIDKFGTTKHHRQKFLQKHFEKSEQLKFILS